MSSTTSECRCDVHEGNEWRAPCQRYNGFTNRETHDAVLMFDCYQPLHALVARETRAALAKGWGPTLTSDDPHEVAALHLRHVFSAAWDGIEAAADEGRGAFGMNARDTRAVVREVGSSWRVDWTHVARHYVARFTENGAQA